MDDFGLHRLTAQQSGDLYELIIERHRRSSFVFTSNRGVDEWLGLFDDPILGNSALDRLAHGAYQLVMDGPSYRANKAPNANIDLAIRVQTTIAMAEVSERYGITAFWSTLGQGGCCPVAIGSIRPIPGWPIGYGRQRSTSKAHGVPVQRGMG